ncbi:MAG TPA: glycoside hydrolase family 38 C-terminal domain-containing protein, partial [Acidimicrobiales bacterium]|nr:glycoside hydrolase family 38 C-terminal domain-containing protein [Acidimicrobiales bacterium]
MLEDRGISGIARSRIDQVLKKLVRPAIHGERAPLEVAAHHVHGEPIAPEKAYTRGYEPFAVGRPWGGAWDTTWFRMRGEIPRHWAGSEVVALLDLGGVGMVGFTAEGLVWERDVPVQGIHLRHREHLVTRSAAGGEPVELYVEAAANPIPPWGALRWPLLMPDVDGPPIYRLGQAELAVAQRDVEALYYDMLVLTQLLDQLPPQEPRAHHVLRALTAACNAIEMDDVPATAAAARAALAPALESPAAASAHRVSAVGHAHIDTAWLWPLRETARKCARTFANAVRLMDEYPEYRFACSQAQQYSWIKDGYPRLYERIREKVKGGQFEPVGSMWVEADCNVPSGESLVRQIVHGKRFFIEELGRETTDLWLPDVFGYSAALPQILRQAGISWFLTQKMSWSEINRFPHHTFWWEGIDGSRIFTHFPPAATYNGDMSVGELVRSVRAFAEHGLSERSLYPFGYGDGGGGPTRAMLEAARRLADLEGAPRVELDTVSSFFPKAQAEATDLPVWVGELYLERHRGTYTTNGEIKRANRRGEEALRAAELWSAAAVALSDGDWARYPAEELERAWKLLLLHQFHDIIPGSSIHWAYEDSRRDHAAVAAITAGATEAAQGALAGSVGTGGMARPFVVFNPASHDRLELVELAVGPGDPNGAGQRTEDGTLLLPAAAPPCGYAALDVAAVGAGAMPSAVSARERELENELLRVRWDDDGLLTSVWDKEAGREVLAAGSRANLLQLHQDLPNETDAWDVDLHYLDKVTDLVELASMRVVERGPLRAGVRFERSFGRSSITQTMRLAAGSRRIEFHTEVDWHERHRFLKVAFPVAIHSSRATYEIQFGHLERPTHANTSWDVARFEVCAHRWADLGEPGYGVALLNDCKYGYDVRG